MEQNNISNKRTFQPSAPLKQSSQVEPEVFLLSIYLLQNSNRVPSHIYDL